MNRAILKLFLRWQDTARVPKDNGVVPCLAVACPRLDPPGESVAVCRKSMEHPNALRSVTEATQARDVS